jgi:hypothetical protein
LYYSPKTPHTHQHHPLRLFSSFKLVLKIHNKYTLEIWNMNNVPRRFGRFSSSNAFGNRHTASLTAPPPTYIHRTAIRTPMAFSSQIVAYFRSCVLHEKYYWFTVVNSSACVSYSSVHSIFTHSHRRMTSDHRQSHSLPRMVFLTAYL